MRDLNLLRELTQLWGVAGYEKLVRQYIGKIVAPYADEMITDAVGNLIVLKRASAVRRQRRSCWRHIWMRLDLW